MTFPALPPEVNVGRLMSGAGPAPALASAASWGVVVETLTLRSAFLTSLLAKLGTVWRSAEMQLLVKNVSMYLAHVEILRAQAILAGARHTKQAADYSSSLAEMAQLPEIAQNHTTNAVLNATNFLGINTAPIAANEAQYAGMWAQNATSMTGYLANTVANMTFVPFVPPKPVATPLPVPPVFAASAAATSADSAATKLVLARNMARSVSATLGMQVAGIGALSAIGAQSAALRADDSEDAASTAEDKPQAKSGQQLGMQLIQQLGTQGVQAAMQVPQQVMQVGQQAAQFGTQVGQGVMQPLSQIISTVGQEHRTESPGYFGTRPGSPTLEALASGGALTGAATALWGPSGGVVPTAIAAPTSWNTGGMTTPPPTALARPMAEPVRPMMPPANAAPVARSAGTQRKRLEVPATAAVPVYSNEPAQIETETIGVPAGGEDSLNQ